MDNSFQRRIEDAVKSQLAGLTGVSLYNSIESDTQVYPCVSVEIGALDDRNNKGCYTGKMAIVVRTSADDGDDVHTVGDNPETRHGNLVDSVGEIIFASGFLAAVQSYDANLLVYRCEPSGASGVRPFDTHFETAHELDVAFTPV